MSKNTDHKLKIIHINGITLLFVVPTETLAIYLSPDEFLFRAIGAMICLSILLGCANITTAIVSHSKDD